MIFLEQNLRGICQKAGIDFQDFLSDLEVDNVHELSIFDLEAIKDEYDVDFQALMFKPLFKSDHLAQKLSRIKLLILDVDGVMTDGGMYFTEKGSQFKKFNTKDGRGIIEITSRGFQVMIISSGYKDVGIRARAEMLGIQKCYIGIKPKLEVLEDWCKELNITLDQVAMIGDDINDLKVMQHVGFSACPSDSVEVIKNQVDLILSKKGGEGCVREFIDNYLEPNPLTK